MAKFQEDWKKSKFKKCEIGNMENLENVKVITGIKGK